VDQPDGEQQRCHATSVQKPERSLFVQWYTIQMKILIVNVSSDQPGVVSMLRHIPLLFTVACIDNALGPVGDTKSTDSSAACSEAAWPDSTVAINSTCTLPPSDWNLKRKWSWDEAGVRTDAIAHVGRFSDSDGDGLITVMDPPGIWLTPDGPEGIGHYLVSGEGDTLWMENSWDGFNSYATIGDNDPFRVGMEYVVGGRNLWQQRIVATVGDTGVLHTTFVEGDNDGILSLIDANVDGSPDVLWDTAVYDGMDGHLLFGLDGKDCLNASADLDLDGLPEILTAGSQVRVLDNNGALRAVCPVKHVGSDVLFGIGNLDEDPEGEFIVSINQLLAVCEADGTLVRSIATNIHAGSLVGIAEIDGDSLPEIVIDYVTADVMGVPMVGINAYDTNLTLLWSHPLSGPHPTPFSVADLDGDGLHEIVVADNANLRILGHDGSELASIAGPASGSWLRVPLVTDVDGDDLAEIVSSGSRPNLAIYENESGGWAVQGASDPWPGVDHFPGDRNLDGSLPAPGNPHWLVPGHNVWQGLAVGAPALPDLGISIENICTDDCDEIIVTVYVSNSGTIDTAEPVAVVLLAAGSEELLGTQIVRSPLVAGNSRSVQFRISATAARSGIQAVVDPQNAIAECANASNAVTLLDLPCP
jgi:CARDB